MSFECTFLGGGNEVGRSALLLKGRNRRMLFDYGMTATAPPKYPMQCPPVDTMFLTHSHLDHCGMIPWLTARYDIPIVSTGVSREIGVLLMEDSIKVGASEGHPESHHSTDITIARTRYR